MDMQLIEKVTAKQIRNDIPAFKAGDTVKVYVKIKEGNKSKILSHILITCQIVYICSFNSS